jgi:ribonuclease BN (tRNA processing enzyme)
MRLLALLQSSVVILGTGTPNADPERFGPAVAVIANGTAYLVDAGAGVMRRAAAAAAKYQIPGLRAREIGVVFLSHLHSDHTIGLADVIHTGWVDERPSPLRLFGPRGTKEMAEHLTKAYQRDIKVRTEGDQPHTRDGWRVVANDIEPGVVYRDSNVTVTAIPVPHTNWDQAYGYRFETRDRVFVISGDTRPAEALASACNGCDVLVHEAYSPARLQARPPDWQKYHTGSHTSTIELAALATRARPKLLVLYHQLYWGASDEELLVEVRSGYPGPVVSAKDLDRFP